MPHVCFALSCAVGRTEEENMAGWEQLSWCPIVCMIVCLIFCGSFSIFQSSVSPPTEGHETWQIRARLFI